MTVEEGAGRWTGIEVPHVPAEGSDGSDAPQPKGSEENADGNANPVLANGQDSGVSTGNFVVDEPTEEGRRKWLVAQTAVVAGSALLVGLGVFAVIGALVGGDSTDQTVPEEEDVAIVDPGPEDGSEPDGSTENSTRSGTRRDTDDESVASGQEAEDDGSTSADDQSNPADDQDLNAGAEDLADPAAPSAGDPAAPSAGDPAAPGAGDPATESPISGSAVPVAEASTPPPGATPGTPTPATTAPPSVIGSTIAPTPLGPPTTPTSPPNSILTADDSSPGGNSTVASTTPSSSPTIPSTTESPVTTTSQPSTTLAATTSQPTTTLATTTSQTTTTLTTTTLPSVTLPLSLIRNPINGSRHGWEQSTQFQAEEVDASQYCWTFLSGAGSYERCAATPFFLLPARSGDVAPGPVTVTAAAIGPGGATIAQQQISISLIAQDILDAPGASEEIYIGNPLVIDFADTPTATEYCVTVSQGSLQQPRCGASRSQVYLTAILLLSGFEPGPVSVAATVNRNGVQIGNQTVTVTLR